MKRVRFWIAAALLLGLGAANLAISKELRAAEAYTFQRCVWIATGAGGCAQGCADWIFTSCGHEGQCLPGGGCP